MARTLNAHRPTRSQQGFMLIEVLVSILIFSVGVMALIGLQARMTEAQTSAKIRADAAYLTSEIVGVMWGDIKNLSQFNGVACDNHPRCKDWKTKVSETMPAGTGSIAINATTNLVTISVTWKQHNTEQHSYSTSTFISSAE